MRAERRNAAVAEARPCARGLVALAGSALCGCALAALLTAAVASAKTLHATDNAQLRYVSAVGSDLYETGRAAGTLPGTMRVHMDIGARFTGSFTILAKGGSIIGHGSAKPHGSGVYESFAGTLVVTGGTGTYEHAHGSAALYGTFDRDTYALTIKTSGTLRY
jgi:hypothetical protein